MEVFVNNIVTKNTKFYTFFYELNEEAKTGWVLDVELFKLDGESSDNDLSKVLNNLG